MNLSGTAELSRLARTAVPAGGEAVVGWSRPLCRRVARRARLRHDYLLPEFDRLAEQFHLVSLRPARPGRTAGDVEAMNSLAQTAEYRAGNLDVQLEYYRIHFRPAVKAAGLLDRLIPRLRANFAPERVLKARAIEHRLYSQTRRASDAVPNSRTDNHRRPSDDRLRLAPAG